jgi:hypothetical protein
VILSGLIAIWIFLIWSRLYGGVATDMIVSRPTSLIPQMSTDHGKPSKNPAESSGMYSWFKKPPPPSVDEDVFEFSIKFLAYAFPQFHETPENNKFHGPKFTDWDDVRNVTHNVVGIETLQPTEEVGYYDLMDVSTRERWGNLVRETGLHGLVFHHYWFGHPVMHKPLLAMLEDGQPNVTFMFNWANEP